jgi:AhpD family alkylhydroperoxidase
MTEERHDSEDHVARFPLHSPDTTTGAAREALADLWERHHGEVGPMVRAMAGSPSVLTGYLGLSRAMKRSKLPRPISERISLAVQEALGCENCLAAHASAARAVGVSDEEIARARVGTSVDADIAALVAFGRQIHRAPNTIDDATIVALRSRGYTDAQILDVVGLVALNVLTGAFNLVAGM